MKSQIKLAVSLLMLAGILAGLTGCQTSKGESRWGTRLYRFYQRDSNTVLTWKGPPIILVQPEDQVVQQGATATFGVVAEPNPLLKYQWKFNGTNLNNTAYISGATNATLTISNVSIGNVGTYTCDVTLNPTKTTTPAVLYMYSASSVSGPYVPGGSTDSCVGAYMGYAKFKSPSGSYWWSRDTGTTQCTITDTTGSSCVTKVEAVESSSGNVYCGSSPKTFPTQAPPTYRYQFTTFVISCTGSPPSAFTLNVNWF